MKARTRNPKKKATVSSNRRVTTSKPSSSSSVCKGIQKSVDAALLSLPPKVQANIDQVLKSLDKSPFRIQDLQALGYRILKHASEISEAIKGAQIPVKKARGQKG
jgi:hypothetical protein